MFLNRRGLCAAMALCAGVCGAVSGVRADQVTDWNDALLDGLRTTRGWAPPQLARAGAIVHSSIYDAVNSVDQRALPSKVFIRTPDADKRAAVIEAGYQSMSALFGAGVGNASFQSQLDSRRNIGLAAIPNSAAKTAGINLGSTVAVQTLGNRSMDGSSASDAYTPGTTAGDWRPDYAGGAPGRGVGSQYVNVTPWNMTTQSQFRPAPCPPTTDPQYTAAYNQVKSLGDRNSATRTADQTQVAWFWGNDRDGTFKPPGHYNVMVREIALTQPATMGAEGSDERLFNNARLLALTNIAQADAGIAAWDAKYTPGRQHFWRPITGIRNGDADGNPDTAGDANWEPLSYGGMGGGQYTPGFPAYVSGHATFGAAAGAVAREFFGTDLISFTLGTDDVDYHTLAGGANARRSFTSISQALTENDLSRVYLGVHWEFDSTIGRAMGTDIGGYTFHNALLVPAPGLGAGLAVLGVFGARRRRR
jgi:PAP2 superfamily